jgi:hypothetical protein
MEAVNLLIMIGTTTITMMIKQMRITLLNELMRTIMLMRRIALMMKLMRRTCQWMMPCMRKMTMKLIIYRMLTGNLMMMNP